MARFSGVTLPNKRIAIALTYVFGIGRPRAATILEKTKVNPDIRANDLSEEQESKIRAEIEKFPTEGDLRQRVTLDIKRLQDINCYRGQRHRRRLPVRGQRTKTNARTRKGPVKMQIANKKKVAS